MSRLDWPPGFERTPPAEREPNRSFQSTLGSTTSDLETEIQRLDPEEWRASTGNAHTKSNGLPLHNANPDDPGFVLRWVKDGEQFAVACDASPRLRDNVRTVYLWIHETRMRSQRPVSTGDTEFAAARLPSGEDGNAVVATAAPCDVLGVEPEADDAEVREVARELLKEHHPDLGGDRETFMRVKAAKEAILGE